MSWLFQVGKDRDIFFHFLINWAQFLALPQENETSLLQDFINNWRWGCFDYDVWELWQQTLQCKKSSKQLLLVWLAQFDVQNVHVKSVLHGFLSTLAKKAGLLVTIPITKLTPPVGPTRPQSPFLILVAAIRLLNKDEL